jgi:hypothetical protein
MSKLKYDYSYGYYAVHVQHYCIGPLIKLDGGYVVENKTIVRTVHISLHCYVPPESWRLLSGSIEVGEVLSTYILL